MRYFFIEGTYVPKHCIYGPRQNEGVIFDDWEWYGINEDLHRWKRDREISEEYARKERNKRDLSYSMTKNWQNTLASIKTQSEKKRIEIQEKIKQDKIDKYNAVLEGRKAEGKPILEKARRALFEGKDTTRKLSVAVEGCAVITEREKQIELNNLIKEEEAKREEVFVEKVRKDAEDYHRELKEEEERKKVKKKAYNKLLAEQVAERRKHNEETQGRLRKAEEEDNVKMNEAMEKLEKCQEKKRQDELRRARMCHEKSYFAAELEKSLALEEEEENEVNKMINKYARRFQKERAAKEAKLMAESIANREKQTEKLAKQMMEKMKKEEELYENRLRQQEEELMKKEKEKVEESRNLADMAAWKFEHEAKRAKEEEARREAFKWTILQNQRKREVDKEWADERRKRDREMKEKTREGYAMQVKEKEEMEEERRKYDNVLCPDAHKEAAELLKYSCEAVKYVQDRGWKDYPILDAVTKLRKELGLPNASEQETEAASKHGGRKCGKPTGLFCYCFKN